MPVSTPAAVAQLAAIPPQYWGVDVEKFDGCKKKHVCFHWNRFIWMDLEQIEDKVERLLKREMGYGLPWNHDFANLSHGLKLIKDVIMFGEDAIVGIEKLKFMSVWNGVTVNFRGFLYGVWIRYTNKCNLVKIRNCNVHGINGCKVAVRPSEVTVRDPICSDVIAARGKIFGGRWVHQETGERFQIPRGVVFSISEEFGFGAQPSDGGGDARRINLLNERMNGNDAVVPPMTLDETSVIDTVEVETQCDEEEKDDADDELSFNPEDYAEELTEDDDSDDDDDVKLIRMDSIVQKLEGNLKI